MPNMKNGSWFILIDPNDNDEIFTYFSDFESKSIGKYYITSYF